VVKKLINFYLDILLKAHFVSYLINATLHLIHKNIFITLTISSNVISGLNYLLFRTRNVGQHFIDISKKNDVNQPLVSLINDNY
jgi:hypothetical protein